MVNQMGPGPTSQAFDKERYYWLMLKLMLKLNAQTFKCQDMQ